MFGVVIISASSLRRMFGVVIISARSLRRMFGVVIISARSLRRMFGVVIISASSLLESCSPANKIRGGAVETMLAANKSAFAANKSARAHRGDASRERFREWRARREMLAASKPVRGPIEMMLQANDLASGVLARMMSGPSDVVRGGSPG